ncbi:putative enzyme related to lactoylglutathione lyase [Bradyrhizobium japonicum USDA 38]|uniref:VOC family protein n=1 Tax=Bradyrhizobium japonicum TaxID=375 RepID=UPI000483DAA8|nr:VOC family protein [Bradyrhizobium japonicum]MCS3893442.1 putative enzyme related to lactoylglutathione lyase [Bradyrhizobium japonicum USDA 38]MCS3945956.1 putative enzyme related to lactoylglutathione lyase [Bradyrhizobium japonicum]
MTRPFVHMELNTPDVPQAKKFYSELFGWNIVDADLGGGTIYSTFRTQEGVTGGIYSSPNSPPTWLPYVGGDDIDETVDSALTKGAKLLRGPQEISQVGWLAVLSDPSGVIIAIWEDIGGLKV